MTTILRLAEREYYDKLLEKNKCNVKLMWHTLNVLVKAKVSNFFPEEFIYNDNTLNTPVDIANGFNEFFVNVGPVLASKIISPDSKLHIYDYMKNKNNDSMFIEETSSDEIKKIVNAFSNKSSCDVNDISMSLVKRVFESLVEPFVYICNLSFNTGTFPDNMKIAKVVPLYKSGSKNVFNNYRPVSLLPQFSKILEKLFNNRLDSFITKYDILSKSQYGFRSNRSTSMALVELLEKMTNSIDDKKITVGVFIDLKKAFDTIDHKLLLKKMEFYGIRGIVLKWVESYLANRKQYVCMNSSRSDLLQIRCGVPHGSILGPKFFILYINDICNCSNILQFILFADDTNIFYSSSQYETLSTIISHELSNLKIWFALNKLSLNVLKTNYMVFSSKTVFKNINIVFDEQLIERVHTTKFLGVIIDDKLSWHHHIAYVCKKLNKSLSVIYKVKDILNVNSLKHLYNALVLPYLFYCCEVWGNASKYLIERVVSLQKRAIRVISKSEFRAHTLPLFSKYKLLKFSDIVRFKILLFMHKAKEGSLPDNIQLFFKLKQSTNVITRQEGKFYVVFARTKLKFKCISIYGVKLWNNLSSDISEIKPFHKFKSLLKKYMIESYIE